MARKLRLSDMENAMLPLGAVQTWRSALGRASWSFGSAAVQRAPLDATFRGVNEGSLVAKTGLSHRGKGSSGVPRMRANDQ